MKYLIPIIAVVLRLTGRSWAFPMPLDNRESEPTHTRDMNVMDIVARNEVPTRSATSTPSSTVVPSLTATLQAFPMSNPPTLKPHYARIKFEVHNEGAFVVDVPTRGKPNQSVVLNLTKTIRGRQVTSIGIIAVGQGTPEVVCWAEDQGIVLQDKPSWRVPFFNFPVGGGNRYFGFAENGRRSATSQALELEQATRVERIFCSEQTKGLAEKILTHIVDEGGPWF